MAAEAKEVSAIGVSLRAVVGDNRELVFQYHIASDASDEQLNSLTDRLMAVCARQTAILDAPKLRDERLELENSLAQFERDMAAVEADWEAAQKARADEIERLEIEHKDVHDAAYKAHAEGGRLVPFEPRGATKSRLQGIARDIARLQAEGEKAVAERAQALQSLTVSIQARKNRIALIDEKLAEIEKVT